MVIGIVAVDRNLAIGKGGKLPWHYSADMKFFKETTTGNAVVMGRRTWVTLKRPLPNRQNIVLTRDGAASAPDNVTLMNDVQSVLDFAQRLDSHLFVIGGAKVYQAFLPHIDRWIVTEVPLSVEGADTFMPQGFLEGFEMYEMRQLDQDLRVKFYERFRGPSLGEGQSGTLNLRTCKSVGQLALPHGRASDTLTRRWRSSPARHAA